MSLYPAIEEDEGDSVAGAGEAGNKRCTLFDNPTGGSGTFVLKYGRLFPKHAINNIDDISDKRSDLAAPMVMRDIDEYQSMVTRERISSRSWHREHLKRHGLVEIGNDVMPEKTKGPKPGEIAREIKETIEQLDQGYVNIEDGVYPKGYEPTPDELDPIDLGADVKDGDFVRGEVAAPGGELKPKIDVDPKSYSVGE